MAADPAGPSAVRFLGVDTSLRGTGYGVIEAAGNRYRYVESGRVRNAPTLPVALCVTRIHDTVRDLIQRTRPAAVAIEGVFIAKNARSSLRLGEARGGVLAACGGCGVEVYEYPPRRVKQAVVGAGGAAKEQVLRMMVHLLGAPPDISEDEADALAIALCHVQTRTSIPGLAPKPL